MAGKTFKMKYSIRPQYLTSGTKRRSGNKMNNVLFIVAHDSGNPASTANGNIRYYQDTKNLMSASAHIFVDDKEIVECIPTGMIGGLRAEKAWHVLYNVPTDNRMFGADANDSAIGVEYCYGGKINARESYKRYVWVLAYTCFVYGLNPATRITGHFILDPGRKTDPKSGLANSLGTSFGQLIQDVVAEYNACLENNELTQEEEKMVKELQERVAILEKELATLKKNAKLDEIPTWAKASVEKAVAKGYIAKASAKGGSMDFYRTVVVLDRAGAFNLKEGA